MKVGIQRHRFCGEDGHECRAYRFETPCAGRDGKRDAVGTRSEVQQSGTVPRFCGGFPMRIFGVTTLSSDAAGDLLDQTLYGDVLSTWRNRSDCFEDLNHPLPVETGRTTKVATWCNNEVSETIIKA
jgi:hypothetical protein